MYSCSHVLVTRLPPEFDQATTGRYCVHMTSDVVFSDTDLSDLLWGLQGSSEQVMLPPGSENTPDLQCDASDSAQLPVQQVLYDAVDRIPVPFLQGMTDPSTGPYGNDSGSNPFWIHTRESFISSCVASGRPLYPTRAEKEYFMRVAGVNKTVINNFFINYRRSHGMVAQNKRKRAKTMAHKLADEWIKVNKKNPPVEVIESWVADCDITAKQLTTYMYNERKPSRRNKRASEDLPMTFSLEELERHAASDVVHTDTWGGSEIHADLPLVEALPI